MPRYKLMIFMFSGAASAMECPPGYDTVPGIGNVVPGSAFCTAYAVDDDIGIHTKVTAIGPAQNCATAYMPTEFYDEYKDYFVQFDIPARPLVNAFARRKMLRPTQHDPG